METIENDKFKVLTNPDLSLLLATAYELQQEISDDVELTLENITEHAKAIAPKDSRLYQKNGDRLVYELIKYELLIDDSTLNISPIRQTTTPVKLSAAGDAFYHFGLESQQIIDIHNLTLDQIQNFEQHFNILENYLNDNSTKLINAFQQINDDRKTIVQSFQNLIRQFNQTILSTSEDELKNLYRLKKELVQNESKIKAVLLHITQIWSKLVTPSDPQTGLIDNNKKNLFVKTLIQSSNKTEESLLTQQATHLKVEDKSIKFNQIIKIIDKTLTHPTSSESISALIEKLDHIWLIIDDRINLYDQKLVTTTSLINEFNDALDNAVVSPNSTFGVPTNSQPLFTNDRYYDEQPIAEQIDDLEPIIYHLNNHKLATPQIEDNGIISSTDPSQSSTYKTKLLIQELLRNHKQLTVAPNTQLDTYYIRNWLILVQALIIKNKANIKNNQLTLKAPIINKNIHITNISAQPTDTKVIENMNMTSTFHFSFTIQLS